MTTPWLAQEEVDDLCFPLTQHAAQIRFILREFGIQAGRKPGGAPLVFRSELERARNQSAGNGQQQDRPRPNRAGLVALFAKAA